jgi:hypothetical protein
MPLNRHRSSDGADPLATLVPHLDDNIAGVVSYKTVFSNLSR